MGCNCKVSKCETVRCSCNKQRKVCTTACGCNLSYCLNNTPLEKEENLEKKQGSRVKEPLMKGREKRKRGPDNIVEMEKEKNPLEKVPNLMSEEQEEESIGKIRRGNGLCAMKRIQNSLDKGQVEADGVRSGVSFSNRRRGKRREKINSNEKYYKMSKKRKKEQQKQDRIHNTNNQPEEKEQDELHLPSKQPIIKQRKKNRTDETLEKIPKSEMVGAVVVHFCQREYESLSTSLSKTISTTTTAATATSLSTPTKASTQIPTTPFNFQCLTASPNNPCLFDINIEH